MDRDDLLKRLENDTQVFRNNAVKAAFEAVDRKDFIHEDYEFEAYEDYALPTLLGQNINQPTTVAFMLELLDAQPGDVALDIGSGTGWTTALLAHMVGKDGIAYGLEIVPQLVEQSKKNIQKYPDLEITIQQAEKEAGLYTKAPFNRILGSAAFEDKESIPMELMFQLADGGVMVIPIGNSIFKFEKINEDEIFETEFPGFNFDTYIK